MMILQECTKGIDKLEFKPSKKSPEKLQSLNSSPKKPQQAAVCMVDLTLRDETDVGELSPLKLQ